MGKATPLTRPAGQIGRLYLGLIILLALVNLIAVFGPELGFDALWYHLTLPKLLITNHRWFYPGGLLYYSAMPRLGETLFIPLLQFLGTSGPKMLQYISGLITTYFIYQIAREFYDKNRSLLGALLFYSTWLVGWQSGSAYVDLIRTMFETIALYFILKNNKLFSGIALGLAIGTKWHAIGTLIFFSAFFSPFVLPIALITSAPWFYLSRHFTNNFVYPLFEPFMTATQLSQVTTNFYSVTEIIKRLSLIPFTLAFPVDDLLNPLISVLFFVGAFVVIRLKNYRLKSILILSVLGLVFWQLTPPPSSRYLLSYLPAIIVISLSSLDIKKLKLILTIAIIMSAIILLFGRTYANSKYLPVILGQQSVNQFLTNNAAKLPDTFIDTDDWVAENIPANSSVLVENWHNLYYLPVNFDHQTWAEPAQKFDYLLTRNTDPDTVLGTLLHTNPIGVQIYKL